MATATLSTKGQITIPKAIRQKYGLEPGDRIEFFEDSDGFLTLWPVNEDISRLKGMVPKPRRPIPLNEMEQAILDQGGKI